MVPALAPMGLLAIFFAGYLAFGIAALVLAAFAWFDYRKNTEKKYGPIIWSITALVSAIWGVYMSLLYFLPAIR